MAEWLKALLSKSSIRGNSYPGFESLLLRQVLTHMNIIHTANAIILQDRKLLAVRETGKDFFIAPGGTVEPDETHQLTLIRELKEELNIDVAGSDLIHYGIFESDAVNHPGLSVRMQAFMVKAYDGLLAPNEEIEEYRWLSSSNEPEIKVGLIFRHQIIPQLKERGLID